LAHKFAAIRRATASTGAELHFQQFYVPPMLGEVLSLFILSTHSGAPAGAQLARSDARSAIAKMMRILHLLSIRHDAMNSLTRTAPAFPAPPAALAFEAPPPPDL
jgi:hypothetical protein